jgi:predicted transposase YdaD
MAKPYDSTTKELLEGYPETWLAYIGLTPRGPVRVVDADLSTFTAEADKVYRVEEPGPHLVHLEIQASADRTIARRMWRYNALLDLRHDLRVRSALILLRPEADHRELIGVLDVRLPDGDRVGDFLYRVVRAWEQPLEPILAGGLGTLPVAPLADVPNDEIPAVIERIDQRLLNETSPQTAATIMEATLLLAGLRLQEGQLRDLRGKARTMNITTESSYYRLAVKEGLEAGRKEGIEEGRKEGIEAGRKEGIEAGRKEGIEAGRKEGVKEGRRAEARRLLLRVAEARLGPPDERARGAIQSIQDVEALGHLLDRALVARTWAELLDQN